MRCYVVSLKFLVHGPKFVPMGLFAIKTSAVNFKAKLEKFFEDPYAYMILPQDLKVLYKVFPQCEWKDFSSFYIDEILLEECELVKK